jgi:predicted Zn finger-like uncharacterized protein
VLITTCAHCSARFRVTPQQLNARQGQVRCGRCSQVFNGFQILERFPDDDTGGRLLADHERRQIETSRAGAAASAPRDSTTTGADGAVDLPIFDEEPAAPATAPEAPAPEPPAAEPQPEAPRRARAVAAPRTAAHARHGSARPAGARVALCRRARRARPGARDRVCVPRADRAALPGAASRARSGVRPHRLQRGVLARRDRCSSSRTRNCSRCRASRTRSRFGARIRNLGGIAQEYPHLELTLTDLTGQAAVRRVLRPTDYLGRPLAYGEVIPAGVEVALQLRLETPRLKATGYELLVFYP